MCNKNSLIYHMFSIEFETQTWVTGTSLVIRGDCCQPEWRVIKLKPVINVTSDATEVKVSVKESVSDGSVLWTASSRYAAHTVTYQLVSFVDPGQY